MQRCERTRRGQIHAHIYSIIGSLLGHGEWKTTTWVVFSIENICDCISGFRTRHTSPAEMGKKK